jgi:hypothetical protein
VAVPSFNLGFGVKRYFFDTPRVRAMLDPATREALSKAGALVRMIARRSMTYRTAKKGMVMGQYMTVMPPPSPPGQPPHAVRPHPWIREFLYYALDPARHSVVVGPVLLPGVTGGRNIPELHETGGMTFVRNRRRRTRHVGGVGEIRVGGRAGRTTKTILCTKTGQMMSVTFARLRTPAQAARANEINELLYGALWYAANFPARPFMTPALAKAAPSIPKLWATSVRSA